MGYTMSRKELTGVEGVDYVVCQICGRMFRSITPTHLKQHNIIMDKYREKYPNNKIKCEKTTQLSSESMTGKILPRGENNKNYKPGLHISPKDYGIEGVDYIISMLSGEPVKQINGLHTKRFDLSVDDYKEMFPTAPLICTKTLNKYTIASEGENNPRYKGGNLDGLQGIEGKNFIISMLDGEKYRYIHSKHTEFFGITLDEYKEKYPNTKIHSDDILVMRRDMMSEDKNPMFGLLPEKTPCYGRKGDKHPMFGTSGYWKGKNLSLQHRISVSCGRQGIDIEDFIGFRYESNERELWLRNGGIDWRIDVFERDDYTCQMCNQRNGRKNVHHILRFVDYPEFRSNINNGITLCIDCHNKTKGHEKEYEDEFLGIIFDNKGREIFGGE